MHVIPRPEPGCIIGGARRGSVSFLAAMEVGVQRWSFSTSLWLPSPEEFNFCLSLLRPCCQQDVTRFVMMQDQKRALVSRLLQLKLVHFLLQIPYQDIDIRRTKEGKPYLANQVVESAFPNLNFNVSHHGDFVVLASEPLCLVGVDVMAPECGRQESVTDYVNNFKSCFTKNEWNDIFRGGPEPALILDQFHRFWCMKEAYIKALGVGLVFDLQSAEFRHERDDLWGKVARVWINGEYQEHWRFFLHKLDDSHWVCVAKGPLEEATDSYRTKLPQQIHCHHEAFANSLSLPEKEFTVMSVEDILPPCRLPEFKSLLSLQQS